MFLSSLASGREDVSEGKTLGALASKAMCPSHNEYVQLLLALNVDQVCYSTAARQCARARSKGRVMLPVRLTTRGPPSGRV